MAAALAFVAVAAAAQGGFEPDAARRDKQRIAADRQRVEARHAEQRAACSGRFLVSDCIEDADRERSVALQRLRARQLEIDEATRRTRAESRRADIAARQAEDAARERARAEPSGERRPPADAASQAAPRPPTPRSPRSAEPSTRSPARPAKPRSASVAAENPAARAEREARSRERYAERQREAERQRAAKRSEVAQRTGSGKPPAAALPVPGR